MCEKYSSVYQEDTEPLKRSGMSPVKQNEFNESAQFKLNNLLKEAAREGLFGLAALEYASMLLRWEQRRYRYGTK